MSTPMQMEVAGTPPETTIDRNPSSSRKRTVSIPFSSTVTGSTFECSLDRAGYSSCRSPKRYRNLKIGRHRFKVRATTTTGIIDLTPDTASWKVKR